MGSERPLHLDNKPLKIIQKIAIYKRVQRKMP